MNALRRRWLKQVMGKAVLIPSSRCVDLFGEPAAIRYSGIFLGGSIAAVSSIVGAGSLNHAWGTRRDLATAINVLQVFSLATLSTWLATTAARRVPEDKVRRDAEALAKIVLLSFDDRSGSKLEKFQAYASQCRQDIIKHEQSGHFGTLHSWLVLSDALSLFGQPALVEGMTLSDFPYKGGTVEFLLKGSAVTRETTTGSDIRDMLIISSALLDGAIVCGQHWAKWSAEEPPSREP